MDLWDAFDLTAGSIVAAVGGGGKTSLVYALAREAAGRGYSAVVTTTTRFTRPKGMEMPMVVEASAAEVAGRLEGTLEPGRIVVAISGTGSQRRLVGYDDAGIASIARLKPGLLAVEADGSGRLPFKAPAEHEPVIPSATTHVVVCVGLEVLGRALTEEFVHRPDLVGGLAEVGQGEPVGPGVVTRVLLHPEGGKKRVPPGARLCALLNNPPTEEHERLGVHIAQRLVYGGYHVAVVACAHRPGDIRAVMK
ncbi:MAG TPA: selenium cofactor biosynthesis protein YqeC [Tepidiformaceae bacterium]